MKKMKNKPIKSSPFSRAELKRKTEATKDIKLELNDELPNKKLVNEEMRIKKGMFESKKNKINLGWWSNRKLAKSPEHTFLIRMFFANGTSKMFVIKTKKMTFKVKGKMYYLYYEEASFDLSMNQYILFYHENFSIPINREVVQKGNEAFFSVTPENLEALIKMKYVTALIGVDTKKNFMMFVMIAIIIIIIYFVFFSGAG